MNQKELPADASTHIYLARADAFAEASRCVAAVLAPPSVWREAVDQGEQAGYADVSRIRDAVADGFVKRVELSSSDEALATTIATQHRLGLGESELLALAQTGAGRAIVDDGRAARAAAALRIQPISTLFLPVFGRRAGAMDEREALGLLGRLAVVSNARASTIYAIERFIRGVT
jgi:hypothetical protein